MHTNVFCLIFSFLLLFFSTKSIRSVGWCFLVHPIEIQQRNSSDISTMVHFFCVQFRWWFCIVSLQFLLSIFFHFITMHFIIYTYECPFPHFLEGGNALYAWINALVYMLLAIAHISVCLIAHEMCSFSSFRFEWIKFDEMKYFIYKPLKTISIWKSLIFERFKKCVIIANFQQNNLNYTRKMTWTLNRIDWTLFGPNFFWIPFEFQCYFQKRKKWKKLFVYLANSM